MSLRKTACRHSHQYCNLLKNYKRIFVEKLDEKRPLGKSTCAWEDSITFLGYVRCHDVKWIQPAEERDQWWTLMNMVVNLQCM
jgi:hypothetical protein